ncbi:MAG: response regulator [Candidatus Omnitrophica bacterium]|nr:response regulator [Candidatus Omnitrophota bacterium]
MRKTILICDDEPGIRESLKLILSDFYDLIYARNGKEAVETLKDRSQNPSLVIMDVKMPQMGGLDALPKIKRARRGIKVMIVTGYESNDVIAEATRLGADEYVVKPFEKDQIRSLVAALINGDPKR